MIIICCMFLVSCWPSCRNQQEKNKHKEWPLSTPMFYIISLQDLPFRGSISALLILFAVYSDISCIFLPQHNKKGHGRRDSLASLPAWLLFLGGCSERVDKWIEANMLGIFSLLHFADIKWARRKNDVSNIVQSFSSSWVIEFQV